MKLASFIACAVLATCFILPSSFGVTTEQLLQQKAFWPKIFKVTQDVKPDLYLKSGEKIGERPIRAGTQFNMVGVYRQGVMIRVGSGVCFVAPDATDLQARIDKRRNSIPVVSGATVNPAALTLQAKPKPMLSAGMKDLIEDNLVDQSGKKQARDQLAGKYVGFYFSAHWCGPCRAFTPDLVKFRNANEDDFEIVFVSSDRSEQDQLDYMKSSKMKWLATAYQTEAGHSLSRKYGVRGIPMLVIVDPDGKLVTKDGRSDVSAMGNKALDQWMK